MRQLNVTQQIVKDCSVPSMYVLEMDEDTGDTQGQTIDQQLNQAPDWILEVPSLLTQKGCSW